MRKLVDNPSEPLDLRLVRNFYDRFNVHPLRCALQQPDGSYYATNFGAKPRHVLQHLHARLTLAVYAADDATNVSKWICLDSDLPDGFDRLSELQALLQTNHRWDSLLESSRRGAHLWIFLDPDSYFRDHALRLLYAVHEIHYRAKADLFPKPSGMGGCVRLPLGVHQKSGTVYPVIHHETGAYLYGADALPYIASLRPVSTTQIIARYS